MIMKMILNDGLNISRRGMVRKLIQFMMGRVHQYNSTMILVLLMLMIIPSSLIFQQQNVVIASTMKYPYHIPLSRHDFIVTTTDHNPDPTTTSTTKQYYQNDAIDNDDDDMIDNNHTRYLQDNSTNNNYQPIRIVYDTRVLDTLYGQGNSDVDAKIDFIKSTILPSSSQKWAQHLYVPIIPSSPSISTIISIDRLVCSGVYATILNETISYDNADIVIIVGGDPDNICGNDGTLAYAIPCGIDNTTNRPIIGTFNFCLNQISTNIMVGTGSTILETIGGPQLPTFFSTYTNANFRSDRLGISLVDITVHEISHILGFSVILYPYTRDENGIARTARREDGISPIPIQRTCGNGTIFSGELPSENVVQVVSSFIDATTIVYEQYIVTERVRNVAQIHFNCTSLLGARLEDRSELCFGSHWNERDYFGELLSPVVSEGSENILSLLTLAFMEDTGWYRVDYRGAGYPSFGIAAGCGFATEECIDNTTGQVADFVQNEFCASPLLFDNFGIPTAASLNSVLCDPSYQSWVLCDLSNIRTLMENERTYFSDPSISTIFFQRADNCPIPNLQLGLRCLDDDDTYNIFYEGESVGSNSRCLNAYYESNTGRAFHPACIRVTCDMEERVVRIGQNDTEQICEFDGQLLSVSGNRTDGATFVCPRLAAVCPQLYLCPDGCFGRGECTYTNVDSNGRIVPKCNCFDTTNTHESCAPTFILDPVPNPTIIPTTTTIETPSPNSNIQSPTVVNTLPPITVPMTVPTNPITTPIQSPIIPMGSPIVTSPTTMNIPPTPIVTITPPTPVVTIVPPTPVVTNIPPTPVATSGSTIIRPYWNDWMFHYSVFAIGGHIISILLFT